MKEWFGLFLVVLSGAFILTAGLSYAHENGSPLEDILQVKITEAQGLVDDTAVIDAVHAQNKRWSGMDSAEINLMDDKWKASAPGDEYDKMVIQTVMSNDCSAHLRDFQKSNPEFDEIFITDDRGLNVCQTNKTSDFFQADEDWWVQGYADGKGHSYHGEIEYDDSARSESIPVFVPVTEPDGGRVIGVCKAVLGLSDLIEDL